MSWGIAVFTLHPALFQKLRGSHDEAFQRSLWRNGSAEVLYQLEQRDFDSDTAQLYAREALDELVQGKPGQSTLALTYLLWFRQLCEMTGLLVELTTGAGAPDFAERAFKTAGVPSSLSMSEIFYRGLPYKDLPSSYESEYCGYLTAEEVRQARTHLRSVPRANDEANDFWIELFRRSCELAGVRNYALVGFYG